MRWQKGVGVVAAIGFALAGYWTWRVSEVRRLAVMPIIQQVPDLGEVSAELKERVSEAVHRARTGWRPVAALRELAKLYQANGFYAEASQICSELLRFDSNNPLWPHLLADLLAGYGKLDEALPLLRQTVALAPDYLPARIRLGDALLKSNHSKEAEQTYIAVLARDADNAYAQLGLTRLDMEAGNWIAARERLQRLVAAQPAFGSAWFLLATIDERLGNESEAETARARVGGSGRFREMPDPWIDALMDDCYEVYRLRVVAGAAANAGDTVASQHWLERALSLAPADAAAERQLGNLFVQSKDFRKARHHLERAVALGPDEADNWNYLIALLNTIGDAPAAERALAAGLVRCPQSPSLHYERGRRLSAAGRLDEATAELETARRLRPEAANAYVELAMIDFRRGRIDAGIEKLRGAVAVEPGQPMALIALARYAIDQADAIGAREWLRRARQQPKVLPQDLDAMTRAYQQKFGRLPW
jgi:tetratricopeptide (TPR) repeat protein